MQLTATFSPGLVVKHGFHIRNHECGVTCVHYGWRFFFRYLLVFSPNLKCPIPSAMHFLSSEFFSQRHDYGRGTTIGNKTLGLFIREKTHESSEIRIWMKMNQRSTRSTRKKTRGERIFWCVLTLLQCTGSMQTKLSKYF